MASEGYHEPIEELSDETRDMHRAIVSLMEELEAIDWYNQRVSACKDEELKAILMHNRDEEKEHAAMMLEWIRRKDPRFSAELKEYLFTDKPSPISSRMGEAKIGAISIESRNGSIKLALPLLILIARSGFRAFLSTIAAAFRAHRKKLSPVRRRHPAPAFPATRPVHSDTRQFA